MPLKKIDSKSFLIAKLMVLVLKNYLKIRTTSYLNLTKMKSVTKAQKKMTMKIIEI